MLADHLDSLSLMLLYQAHLPLGRFLLLHPSAKTPCPFSTRSKFNHPFYIINITTQRRLRPDRRQEGAQLLAPLSRRLLEPIYCFEKPTREVRFAWLLKALRAASYKLPHLGCR